MAILALAVFLSRGLGQEDGSVTFNLNHYHSYQPIRWDVVLLVYAAWKWVGWVARREAGEPAVAIPTALTAIFVLTPYAVSWFVNLPAMILLSLLGEATSGPAIVIVWTTWFGIMKGIEHQSDRARFVRLRIGCVSE